MEKKKYELVPAKQWGFYRVRAVRDFGLVEAGDLGGMVESEQNLSHEGLCWVDNDASIWDSARVSGNAQVRHMAQVYGSAHVYGHAQIQGNAHVRGCAVVYGHAVVDGHALVHEYAIVEGHARVHGFAHVHGNATVGGFADVAYSHCTRDISLRENLRMSIKCQTGLETIKGHVYGYKYVRPDLSSLHDPTFKYVVGEYAEAPEYDNDPSAVCVSGLHLSNAFYWESRGGKKVLKVRVALDDIISVQSGKIRCKRLYVVGICDNEVF